MVIMRLSRNYTAALLAVASTGILSFVDNFIASTFEISGLWQFHAIRTLIAVPVLLLLASVLRRPVRPNNMRRVALRSLAISGGLIIYFACLGFLPVAQAGAGLYSAPLWVMLLAALGGKQGAGTLRFIIVAVGFCGAILLLQPDFAVAGPWSLAALAAGLLYAIGIMLTRYTCADEPAFALSLGVFMIMGIVGATMVAATSILQSPVPGVEFLTAGWQPMNFRFLWLTALQAIGAVVAVTLIAQAYRMGTPAFVAVFEYSFLVFAAVWAWLLWGQTINLASVAGIAIVIAAGVAMAVSEYRDVDKPI